MVDLNPNITMYKNQKISHAYHWPMHGVLLGAILIGTSLSLVAQSTETTTTTTKAVAAPVIQPSASTTQSVTTKTSNKSRLLYLRSSYHGQVKNGGQVFVRPNGRVYNEDVTYIGHLTDFDGNEIMSIPADRRYKIRNANGTIIASTQLTSLYDSNRTVTLARQDSTGHLIVETVETTSTTTAPAVVIVPVTPVQSSTTTTTTQSAPARLTVP